MKFSVSFSASLTDVELFGGLGQCWNVVGWVTECPGLGTTYIPISMDTLLHVIYTHRFKHPAKLLYLMLQPSNIRHKNFRRSVRPAAAPLSRSGDPLNSEMGWTGELWSKTNLLK